MATSSHIASLLLKELSGSLSVTEHAELHEWINTSNNNRLLHQELTDEDVLTTSLQDYHPDNDEALQSRILATIHERIQEESDAPLTPVHRIHFLRTAWFRYAAAIILLFGIGTYIFLNNQKQTPSVTTTINPVPVQNDVAPGGNKAILTLADGSKITLDSAANGEIAQQQNAKITKNGAQVIYKSDYSPSLSTLSYNTMSTPRGGQYQLTLPDGSQVWLNAESSITYPTAFSETERERRVTIKGEAYFEVAKDKTKPFIVVCHPDAEQSEAEGSAEERFEIEVLGTHFNVNTYKEEPTKNITLLEGSVRIALSAPRSP